MVINGACNDCCPWVVTNVAMANSPVTVDTSIKCGELPWLCYFARGQWRLHIDDVWWWIVVHDDGDQWWLPYCNQTINNIWTSHVISIVQRVCTYFLHVDNSMQLVRRIRCSDFHLPWCSRVCILAKWGFSTSWMAGYNCLLHPLKPQTCIWFLNIVIENHHFPQENPL